MFLRIQNIENLAVVLLGSGLNFEVVLDWDSTVYIYSETWELGTPKGLSKTVLNSEVILFLRSIPHVSM